jgi:hypothetical protein
MDKMNTIATDTSEEPNEPELLSNNSEETGPSDSDIEQSDQSEVVDGADTDDPDTNDLVAIGESSPEVTVDDYYAEESISREPLAPINT